MSEPPVFRSLDDVPAGPWSLTIGFFDGVHRGHQALVARAAGHGERTLAVTFDRHPTEIVRPDATPPLLMTTERRVRCLIAAGADAVLVLPFTRELSQLSPEEFAAQVLAEGVGARWVVVGENFRFGHRAAGDAERLAELGPTFGFDVDSIPLLDRDRTTVSSTRIREALADGDVEWAAWALGRPHVVDGCVVAGDRRGRRLGFPTANLDLSAGLQLPAIGVYAGHVETPAGRFPAATSVGIRPTFDGRTVTVEAYLLDFDGDLYGEEVGVEFRHRLRDEKHFEDVDRLVAAMEEDVRRTRALLGGG